MDSRDASIPALTDERFRLLVESVRDYAIFLLDPRGMVTSWNEGAARIKGYTEREIVGRHFSTFYLPEDVAAGKCEAELHEALAEGRIEDEGWRLRKDGSQFWANVTITALKDRSGQHVGFAKVTRDLTDRTYRTFVEATNAIVWTANASGQANADSPSWRAFTGQTPEEWRGLQGWEPVHPDDRAAAAAAWTRAKEQHTPFETEFRLRRHDGVYVWMAVRAIPQRNPDGSMRSWFGATFDISGRKQAETRMLEALTREQNARVAAEKAQSLLTTTLRSIGDAVIVTDTDGRVTFMNRVAETLTGWATAEALGRPLPEVFSIVNESHRQTVANPVEKVLREGIIVGLANHTLLVRRDKTEIPIDDSAAPIVDAAGALFGVVLVFRDVTKEKRAAARRDYLARASEILANTDDYRESLTAAVELTVPSLADWCTLNILEPGSNVAEPIAVAHVDPSKVALARELSRRFPPDPNAKTGVTNVLRTGCSELYAEIPSELIEARATSPDHLRILRELQLKSAMVVPLRGRERVFGALTFAYAESGRRYGEEDLQFAEELARRAAQVLERRKLEEERKQLLDAERAAREQAELANRAKSDFLATVSHELRNPLQTILGWSKVLLQRDVPADIKKPLMTIERNARAQARLIEDVLDVSRIVSGKLRLERGPASVSNAVTDAVEAVRASADQKRVTIVPHVESGVELFADQVRLQQIVSNLVANAVKFTPSGGLVSIDARQVGGNLQIVVHDTGEGIEPELLHVIFEPFRQADGSSTRRHGGLGLGLAIVRQLVVAHGGTVRAESQGKGTGSTFIVELPSRPSTPPLRSSQPPPLESSAPRLSNVRVLVVDDQRDALELAGEILVDAGAIVELSSSAEEALIKLQDFRPDVLVSDIGMPDVDGHMFLRRLRRLDAQRGGRTPAVALTAHSSREDAERCFASGFQMHIGKPLDPDHLVRVVANLAGVPTESK